VQDNAIQLRIWGGSGDDDASATSGSGAGGGGSSVPSTGTTSTGSSAGSDTDSGGADSGSGDIDYAAKYEEERARSVSLSKSVNDANSQLEKLQRQSRSEDENRKADLEKFKKIADEFEKFKKSTYLELQILKETKFKWHEKAISDVAHSIDMDSLVFEEADGKVSKIEGLGAALAQVAKDKPYLLVSAKEASERRSDDEKPDKASGSHPFGGTGGTGKATTDSELMKKYKIA